MSTTDNLAIGLIAVNQKQKEVIANEGIAALEAKITEFASVAVIDGTNAITAGQVRGNASLVLTGAPAAAFGVVLPAVKNALILRNATAQQADVACTGGALVYALSAGSMALVYCDGAEVYGVAGGGGGGGGGVTAFAGLSDVPPSYLEQSGKFLRVNTDEDGIEYAAMPFEIGGWVPGTFAADQVLFRLIMPRACALPVGAAASACNALGAATDSVSLGLQKNGVAVGTADFSASGTSAAISVPDVVLFEAGDTFSMHAPASADATLADVSFVFVFQRG